MEGRQIGRYRISRELGRGAMGIVYAALDPVIGRTVAIKTIHLAGLKESTSAGELRDRLRREAQAAGILNHPGIITIHDIGDEGEEAFIVMEYVDGQTLEEVFASGIPQHTTVLLGVLKKSAEALDFAHARGIVHRDIKPSNIMVARDGSVKVADFGVAKFSASTSMTQTGFVLGTPNYMSPEQAQARKLDGRSDQFALAVLAYRVLTGKLPFNAPTLTAVLTKLLWEQPEFSDTDLHPQVRAVLAKALSKDPAQRYATCAEFVGRLEKAYMSCRPEVPAYEDPLSPVTEGTEPGDQTFLMRASPPDSSLETHALPAPTDGGNATASNFSLAGLGNEDETSTSFTGPPTEAAPPVPPPAVPPPVQEASPAPNSRVRSGATTVIAALVTVVVAVVLLAYTFVWRRHAPPQAPEVVMQVAPPAPAPAPAPAAAPDPPKPAVSEPIKAEEAATPAPVEPAPIPAKAPEKAPARTRKPAKAAPVVPAQATAPATAPAQAAPAVTVGETPHPAMPKPVSIPPQPAATGVITWTGRMQKNAVLVINGTGASFGSVAGTFPGLPIKVEVEPPTVQVRELPRAENGWKQLMLYSGSERFSSIVIRWTALH